MKYEECFVGQKVVEHGLEDFVGHVVALNERDRMAWVRFPIGDLERLAPPDEVDPEDLEPVT